MRTGLLIGPYARQLVGWRLKLWFACKWDDEPVVDRYEMFVDLRGKDLKSRRRATDKKGAPLLNYRVPADLTQYPSESFPRFPRDTLAAAARDMLRDQDIASLTMMRAGILPLIATHGTIGETDPCTSSQLRLI